LPSITLAEHGIRVTPGLRRQLDGWVTKADTVSRRALLPDGRIPDVGELWRQQDLASLLRGLAQTGPSSFYHGDVASTIVRQIREHGGILAEDDFANYRAPVVEPISVGYRGDSVFPPPPPP